MTLQGALGASDAVRADLIRSARAVAAREIAPAVRDYDRAEQFPVEIVRKAAELGWVGAVIDPEYGGSGLEITDMVVGTESARALTHELARAKDAGVARPRRAASTAKMHASDVAMQAVTAAVQIHGAHGISDEFPVGRYFRDAKVFQIVEGNNQLHRGMVAEYALGYRGADR